MTGSSKQEAFLAAETRYKMEMGCTELEIEGVLKELTSCSFYETTKKENLKKKIHLLKHKFKDVVETNLTKYTLYYR